MAPIEYFFFTANPNYRPWLQGSRPWQNVDQNNRSERAYKFVTSLKSSFDAFPKGSPISIDGVLYSIGSQRTIVGGKRHVLLHPVLKAPAPTLTSIIGMDFAKAEDRLVAHFAASGRWSWKGPNRQIIEKDKDTDKDTTTEPPTRQKEANEHYIRWNTLEIQRRAIENNIPIAKDQQIHYLCDVMNIFR